MIITKSDTIAPIFNVTINKVNYSIHICPNNDIDINYCDLGKFYRIRLIYFITFNYTYII